MKNATLICLLFLCKIAQSQTITNNIEEVKKGEFKGNTIIYKADNVTVIINEKRNDSIFFIGADTVYDTASKYYTTMYRFIPAKNGISFDVDVVISFDKPFTPWWETLTPPPNTFILGRKRDVIRVNALNGESKTSDLFAQDYKTIRIRGSVVGDALDINLKSREKLNATIQSIYGAIGSK
ncbi:MAG: hypothetical protein P4L51_06035 [Puia sp.]|nr:hypothetical protein [Puia sp.]